MVKLVSIDPGKNKCGLVLAEISEKKVYKAIILESELIGDYVRDLNSHEDISKIIIGNGTTLLILFDAKQIPFVGNFTTSSKLNAGELKLLFLFL